MDEMARWGTPHTWPWMGVIPGGGGAAHESEVKDFPSGAEGAQKTLNSNRHQGKRNGELGIPPAKMGCHGLVTTVSPLGEESWVAGIQAGGGGLASNGQNPRRRLGWPCWANEGAFPNIQMDPFGGGICSKALKSDQDFGRQGQIVGDDIPTCEKRCRAL